MTTLEQLRQRIETLSPADQERLLEMLDYLTKKKERVIEFLEELEQEKLREEKPINNYENFKKMGLIGTYSTDQDLSIHYKEILAEEWSKKYDNR